jgi:hypothetical protein
MTAAIEQPTGKQCECGAPLVELHGATWCANTLARFRVLHGEPQQPSTSKW